MRQIPYTCTDPETGNRVEVFDHPPSYSLNSGLRFPVPARFLLVHGLNLQALAFEILLDHVRTLEPSDAEELTLP